MLAYVLSCRNKSNDFVTDKKEELQDKINTLLANDPVDLDFVVFTEVMTQEEFDNLDEFQGF
jgi:hypothetical protein